MKSGEKWKRTKTGVFELGRQRQASLGKEVQIVGRGTG